MVSNKINCGNFNLEIKWFILKDVDFCKIDWSVESLKKKVIEIIVKV